MKIKIKKRENLENILNKLKNFVNRNNIYKYYYNSSHFKKPSYKKYLKKKEFIKKEQYKIRKKYFINKYK